MKKIFKIICCIFVVIFSLGVSVGCRKREKNTKPGNSEVKSIFQCYYETIVTEFNINDVYITYFFGIALPYNAEEALTFYDQIKLEGLYFSVREEYDEYHFTDEENYKEICIKQTDDDFISDEYIITNEHYHSEMLTVPKDLFIYQKGNITFDVKAYIQGEIEILTGTTFSYQLENDKVLITDYYGKGGKK